MLRRIGMRVLTFLISLLVASFIIFAVLNALPGDVAQVILGTNATPDAVAELQARMGLNDPFFVRYFHWLTGLVTGDFGQSALTGESVMEKISPKLGVTCWLVVLSVLLSILIAVPVGMFSAVKRRKISGFLVSTLAQIGMAIPAFLLALVMVVVFAAKLNWLPSGGYVPLEEDFYRWWHHLILPVVSLAVVQAAMLSRFVRSAFIEVITEDYFRTAQAVGWTKWRALWRHGLRNASLSVVTVLGLQLATMFIGAIVVENVLAIPGLGSQLLRSVSNRDLPMVQGIVMLLVFLVLVVNALVDISYMILDPRLRTKPEVAN